MNAFLVIVLVICVLIVLWKVYEMMVKIAFYELTLDRILTEARLLNHEGGFFGRKKLNTLIGKIEFVKKGPFEYF